MLFVCVAIARGEIWTVVHLKVAVESGYLLAITATDGKANTTEYRRVRLTSEYRNPFMIPYIRYLKVFLHNIV